MFRTGSTKVKYLAIKVPLRIEATGETVASNYNILFLLELLV